MCWHFNRFFPGWYYAVSWLFAHLGSSREVQQTVGMTWCICQAQYIHHHSLCLVMWLNTSLMSSGCNVRGYDMRDLHVPQLWLHFSCLSGRIWTCYCHHKSRPSMPEDTKLTFGSNWVPFFWDLEPYKLPTSERNLMTIHLAYLALNVFSVGKVHEKLFSVLSCGVMITKFLDLRMKSQQRAWSKASERIVISFSRLWGRPEYCSNVCLLFKFCWNVLAKF